MSDQQTYCSCPKCPHCGKLLRPPPAPETVRELDLSVRASNCLEAAGITLVSDLVKRSETDMGTLPNFGRTSLKEIKRKLADHGLRFRDE